MNQFHSALAALFRFDPGKRGLAASAPAPDLANLAHELARAERVIVLTGFPIRSARSGETDGPCGALNITRALLSLGKSVTLATDELNLPIIQAMASAFAPGAQVLCIPHEGAEQACLDALERVQPTHIISIERPGKHAGHFHNMRGQILDDLVADTDALFSRFSGVKIAIGDGGNELGMSSLRETVLATVPNGADIVADEGCDFPLAASISNWWGWGIQALLSVHTGRDLMPSDADEDALLAACVAAGAVDGMSCLPAHSVDGQSFEANLGFLRRVRELAHAMMPVAAGGKA